MNSEIERIAAEVDACNLPYRMELVQLIDGVSTYELRINGKVLEFSDQDELYEHVRMAKANAKAAVIIKALSTARAEARKAALEEAAKVAEKWSYTRPGGGDNAFENIASAIRALIERESEEG